MMRNSGKIWQMITCDHYLNICSVEGMMLGSTDPARKESVAKGGRRIILFALNDYASRISSAFARTSSGAIIFRQRLSPSQGEF
jgi:hypothetical protein